MSDKRTSRFCPACDKQVLAVGKSPNHVLHLLLTVFTLGAWWLIWGGVAAASVGGYRCSVCGTKV